MAKFTWIKKKRARSVLGLSLSGGRLRAVHAVQAKGAIEVAKSASAQLSLDLQHPESELVGREIKNRLQEAGINERACVVAVPPAWIMSLHAKLPELSPEDAASFLQLEAEKGFPYDPAQLQIATSFHRSASANYATQLAVRRDRLVQLAAMVMAAGLKPVSYSLGLAALDSVIAPAGKGRVTVAVEPDDTTVLVSAGGGIAAFRTFKASISSEGGESLLSGGAAMRELRLTLEQVPADLRAELSRISLCGSPPMVDQLAESLEGWTGPAGLEMERGDGADDRLPELSAEALARRWLERGRSELEFMLPRPPRWTIPTGRFGSKRLVTAGLALGGAVAVGAAILGWQEIRLHLIRSEWHRMEAQVGTLTEVQNNVQFYRPWYDRSFPNLRILGRVTQCFPENGSVTAKAFNIRDAEGATTVSVSGTASDHGGLLRTLDQLRKTGEVQDLKVETISGKTPSQFTFSFRWIGGSGS